MGRPTLPEHFSSEIVRPQNSRRKSMMSGLIKVSLASGDGYKGSHGI